jgi:hypothetical protein
MRLWTLSPRYLDQKGLVACWREALLAQRVLLGRTRGYKHHPQLARFRAQPDPIRAIGHYLRALHAEAVRRGYRFDESKIVSKDGRQRRIPVTSGQVGFEYQHLLQKLQMRDPERARQLALTEPAADVPLELHPLFHAVEGGIEPWERV